MLIGGFQKVSLIDYPNKVCAIVFTQGCNFRCPYCHNPELVDPTLFQDPIEEKEIFSFLKSRVGKLDAVEITGGEPTLQKDLITFIKKIKDMGFLIKLDTNGSNPEILEKIIKERLVDYIAMDIKAPLDKYEDVIKVKIDTSKIKKSIELIKKSNISYEFRTTIVKSLLSKGDLIKIGKLIKGAKLYILQKFIPSKTLNSHFLKEGTYGNEELRCIKNELENYVEICMIR
ncbi:MAG: anaerobic ribonucleoside-triphosphate reductase activating protein [Nanoarchaeota archaeon]|nr:anaerobic ribonucleoside-triphosphate reductase activating protein [Nanoarchaeota archaeon]